MNIIRESGKLVICRRKRRSLVLGLLGCIYLIFLGVVLNKNTGIYCEIKSTNVAKNCSITITFPARTKQFIRLGEIFAVKTDFDFESDNHHIFLKTSKGNIDINQYIDFNASYNSANIERSINNYIAQGVSKNLNIPDQTGFFDFVSPLNLFLWLLFIVLVIFFPDKKYIFDTVQKTLIIEKIVPYLKFKYNKQIMFSEIKKIKTDRSLFTKRINRLDVYLSIEKKINIEHGFHVNEATYINACNELNESILPLVKNKSDTITCQGDDR